MLKQLAERPAPRPPGRIQKEERPNLDYTIPIWSRSQNLRVDLLCGSEQGSGRMHCSHTTRKDCFQVADLFGRRGLDSALERRAMLGFRAFIRLQAVVTRVLKSGDLIDAKPLIPPMGPQGHTIWVFGGLGRVLKLLQKLAVLEYGPIKRSRCRHQSILKVAPPGPVKRTPLQSSAVGL